MGGGSFKFPGERVSSAGRGLGIRGERRQTIGGGPAFSGEGGRKGPELQGCCWTGPVAPAAAGPGPAGWVAESGLVESPSADFGLRRQRYNPTDLLQMSSERFC